MADREEDAWTPETEAHFWTEVGDVVQSECDDHEDIDDALREWLDLASRLGHRPGDYLGEVVDCARMLLTGSLFLRNKDYVRTQIIHSLLQEEETIPLRAIACLLLLDGNHDDGTFPRMVAESCFPRMLELIAQCTEGSLKDPVLHRLLLQLLYEISRVERLGIDELKLVDDVFIHYLFQIIEGVSDDVNDPYHYPIIRVLLVLNEQYMLASTKTVTDTDGNTSPVLTNRIVKCLSYHGPSFRTFGENVILLLNRETETSLQLLILKLLYLLFTNKATYEYFYTNDLRVLLDVIIRNLMDLPDAKMSLRHTYLRVLYPLLAHTQLSEPPWYKQDEILRVLHILRGSQNVHFAPADETTLRLVERVSNVKWLETTEAWPRSGEAEVARKLLGISLSPSSTGSSISVGDVAAVTEQPGPSTDSRFAALDVVVVEEEEATADSPAMADSPTLDVVAIEFPRGRSPKTESPLSRSLELQPPPVPKHRHGSPLPPPLARQQQQQQQQRTGGRDESGQTATAAAAAAAAARKIPPKAPPPRRFGKAKVATGHGA